jgi:hypothetical protein
MAIAKVDRERMNSMINFSKRRVSEESLSLHGTESLMNILQTSHIQEEGNPRGSLRFETESRESPLKITVSTRGKVYPLVKMLDRTFSKPILPVVNLNEISIIKQETERLNARINSDSPIQFDIGKRLDIKPYQMHENMLRRKYKINLRLKKLETSQDRSRSRINTERTSSHSRFD